MVEIRRAQEASALVEQWATDLLRQEWPQEDDLGVLVEAQVYKDPQSNALRAVLLLFALLPDGLPMYARVMVDAISMGTVASAARQAMQAIRQQVQQEAPADATPSPASETDPTA